LRVPIIIVFYLFRKNRRLVFIFLERFRYILHTRSDAYTNIILAWSCMHIMFGIHAHTCWLELHYFVIFCVFPMSTPLLWNHHINQNVSRSSCRSIRCSSQPAPVLTNPCPLMSAHLLWVCIVPQWPWAWHHLLRIWYLFELPSGQRLHNYGTSPFIVSFSHENGGSFHSFLLVITRG
jgi:hypothetical protein